MQIQSRRLTAAHVLNRKENRIIMLMFVVFRSFWRQVFFYDNEANEMREICKFVHIFFESPANYFRFRSISNGL